MQKRVYVGLLVGVIISFCPKCNVFGVFSPTDHDRILERYGPEALVQEGMIKMRSQEWREAYDLFHRATTADPAHLSEAWFYKGKCILRLYNVDLRQVWDEINPDRENDDAVPFLYQPPEGKNLTDSTAEPFYVEIHGVVDTAYTLVDSAFLERKRIYDAMSQAVKCLERIHYDRDNLMDGRITREQYESDYLIEISVKSMLGVIDHNHNDTLDYHSEERDLFRIMCADMPNLDELKFDSLKTISNDPKEINSSLDLILGTVNKADTSYNNFHEELVRAAEKEPDAGLRTDMGANMGDMISDFKNILPYFYYNDKKNNDEVYDTVIEGSVVRRPRFCNTDTTGEGQWRRSRGYPPDSEVGRVDRMIWIDWDYDDKIDVYENDLYHIGDPDHMNQFDQYYTEIDSPGADYKRYVYTGPHTYEFIAGDWGVDEEIMDNWDNDQDGLTDEDTRIVADTLDDDGDYVEMTLGRTFDINTTTPSNKKLWLWGNGPYRFHPGEPFSASDVGTVLTDAHGTKFKVISFIDSGAVQAVIDPELNTGGYDPRVMPDSLGKTVVIRAEWPGHHVLDPVVWVDQNNNGVIDGVDATAPSYNNEFIAGDWGIDEERFEGMDNDGDGLVDEDVGEYLPPAALRDFIRQNQAK
ncbi:MAG: hypothetical protein GF344_20395 [Chitinivibrionales bacterium]|nr:hypothetical protein [Chitinivibrionales bacterium]MBD3358962.1 hypothetical protein [Chitinivibrionales bacterium]